MIKNKDEKAELTVNKEKIVTLDEIFRLAELIIKHDEAHFEMEIEKGLSKDVAYMIYALLEKYQENAKSIEEEIMFWDWKYQARRLM